MNKVTMGVLVAGIVFAGSSFEVNAQDSAASLSSDELFQKGYCFDTGECAAKNEKEAVKWYRLASDKGNVAAERNLAGMYGSGRGVKKNNTEAKRLFLLAADSGDAQGQYAYARWYSKNKAERLKYLLLAVAQNHPDAMAFYKTLPGSKKRVTDLTTVVTTPKSTADNFELSVQAEAGLMLVIAGYAPDGTQIFVEGTSKLQKNNVGALSYLVRVDRSVLEHKGLAEWCVVDLSGKWKLLPKDQPASALCDNQPSDISGRYEFVSRRQKVNSSIQAATTLDVQVDINPEANFDVFALRRSKIVWQSGDLGAKTKIFQPNFQRQKSKLATKGASGLGRAGLSETLRANHSASAALTSMTICFRLVK